MTSTLFVNAKIVTSQEIFEGSVLINKGIIEKVKRGQLENEKADARIDLTGKYLLPGLIDVHVHFRTPGMTELEDWTTGSKAALAGGVTTVLDMPNTIPPTIDEESLAQKRAMVGEKALVNYGLYMGATMSNLSEISKVKNIAGVKIFMAKSTGALLVSDKVVLESFFKKAGQSECKILLAIHAEDEECINENMEKYRDNDDPKIHSTIRSEGCALEAVKLALHLAKKYNVRMHLCHVSSKKELDTIRELKNEDITIEATPHHLFLSNKEYESYGNLVKVNPPLRSLQDVSSLWEGIEKGWINIIGTDHAPHLLESKQLPYAKAPSGVPGVQTMLPLLLNASHEKKITLTKIVELCSYNPARKFAIKNKGVIQEGFDADVTVVDMDLLERVCHRYLWTKPDWSPFHGWYLQGWPVMTFVNGELMYKWRDVFGTQRGKEVTFLDLK